MKRALLVLSLFGCKERGTITVDLSLATCPAVTPTAVRFQAIKNGKCSSCTCATCACDTTADHQCVVADPAVPIEDARANGIGFDPPSAGAYAVTYEFLDGTLPVAVICANIEVDADGTASSVTMPAPTCCP